MTVTTRAGKGAKLTNAEMDSNMNSLNWRHGGTLASSSTITPTDEYNYFDISGTASVSGMSATHSGNLIRMTFLAAGGTLVHNATSFVLPGNANITWAAGDTVVFVNTNSTNWKCIAYQVQSAVPGDVVDLSAVSLTIKPDTTNLYDLGSATKQWQDLYIDGNAYIDGLLIDATGYINAISGVDTAIASPSVNMMATTYTVKGYADTVGAHAYGRVDAAATNENTYNAAVAKTATGTYRVTMPTAASTSTTYTAVATVNASNRPRVCCVDLISSTVFDVYIWDMGTASGDAPALEDQQFFFAVFDNDQGL